MLIFALTQVLTDRPGLDFLELLRSYLELDLFASLTLQTESTLEIGREELKTFGSALEVRAGHV